jgi:nucleotide-binding universal stress UspA family protein
MFDDVLFPTDGSDGAKAAFNHVLDLADGHDATVHVLNVADTTQDSVVRMQGDVVDVLEREGNEFVEEAAERARARGLETVTEVRQGTPADTILGYARTRDVDLVTMPVHGQGGIERFLVGSTTDRVVRGSEIPVLTIRPTAGTSIEYPYSDVLVPTDGSGCAAAAIDLGSDLAVAEGAAVHFLCVVQDTGLGVDFQSSDLAGKLDGRAAGIVEEAARSATEAGVDTVHQAVEHGSAIADGILSYVENDGIDLVVVGTHGRTGIDRYVLGSVAEKLVRSAPVPVLTVRHPTEE